MSQEDKIQTHGKVLVSRGMRKEEGKKKKELSVQDDAKETRGKRGW